MTGLYDTHAHYNNERFEDEFEGGTTALLHGLLSSDIYAINNIGWDIESSRAAMKMSEMYDRLYFAAGIHPCDTYKYESMERATAELEEIILSGKSSGKLVALGEIGYDFHYDDTDRECQARFFDAQMKLAAKHSLPVVIHDRDAHGPTLEMLKAHPNVRGVLHSYSGSAESAREMMALGYYISFTGVVTFKNADHLRSVVKSIPLDRIMIETDCPYLTPVPFRGKTNHSGLMHYTCEKIAELFGVSYEEMADITRENAKRFFGVK